MGIQVEAQVKFQPVDGQTLTHVFNDGSSGPGGGAVTAALVITGKVRGSVAAEPNGWRILKMLIIRMEN